MVNSNFAKILVAVTIFITLGIGVFSMAAMQHRGDGSGCMTALNHDTGCTAPVESQSCLNFHLNLLQTFSQNHFLGNIGFGIMLFVFSLGLLLLAISNLFADVIKVAGISKVRFRQLLEDTATVFYDNLGYWLLNFAKRDPVHTFATV